MFATPEVTIADLDAVLTRLPSNFSVGRLDDARLVVGPTGCTVLIAQATGPAPEHTCSELAQQTRLSLADHLSWVPFVDSLVVTAEGNIGSIVSVELDLLIDLLTDGPTILDDATAQRLAELVAERRLRPSWQLHGQGVGDLAAQDTRLG